MDQHVYDLARLRMEVSWASRIFLIYSNHSGKLLTLQIEYNYKASYFKMLNVNICFSVYFIVSRLCVPA